jgi:Domain of Unknown Function (DUF1259)
MARGSTFVWLRRRKRDFMRRIFASLLLGGLLAIAFGTVTVAAIPQQARISIDRISGGKGVYLPDDRAYILVFPREAATIVNDDQTLSPSLGLNSWVAFASAVYQEAILTGQFLQSEDEANAVLTVTLDAGLELTGLAFVRF